MDNTVTRLLGGHEPARAGIGTHVLLHHRQVRAKEDRLLPAPKHPVKVPSPLFISTGNLQQRIQLLIVSQCYGGLFCGNGRLLSPAQTASIARTDCEKSWRRFIQHEVTGLA